MLFDHSHVTNRLTELVSSAVGMRMRGVVKAVSDAFPAASNLRLAEFESHGM